MKNEHTPIVYQDEKGKYYYKSKDILQLPPKVYEQWVYAKSTKKVDEVKVNEKFQWLNFLLTKSTWWLALLTWVPVIIYLLSSFHINQMFYLLGGILVWYPVEYLFHRLFFHMKVRGKKTQFLHLSFHGAHHAAPKDRYHIIAPTTDILWQAVLIYSLLVLIGISYPKIVLAGILIQYIRYDLTHYILHTVTQKKLKQVPIIGSYLANLKINHMMHHNSDPHKNFAISFNPKIFNALCKKIGLEL